MHTAPDLDQLLARKRQLQSLAASRHEFEMRLQQLRAWQAGRLARSYADLGADPRYSQAVAFFLSDIYAPHEFTHRDRDLTRALGKLRRALPAALLAVLGKALELDVLTLALDQAMTSHLTAPPTESSYAQAYRAVGRRPDRERQIELIRDIGKSLDAVVRHRWLGLALRAAHGPAHLAGFGALQDFLERGWSAFRTLPAGDELFDDIRRRETAVMDALFQARPNPFAWTAAAEQGAPVQNS